MIKASDINNWTESFLEGTDKFLVDIEVNNANLINIYLDSDTSLTIDDCVNVSRLIEGKLDREEQDFELNVSSVGLDRPLKLHRQYIKNIGREVRIITIDDKKIKGTLLAFKDGKLTLQPELKPKKKKDMQDTICLSLDDIKETIVMVSFKNRKK